MHSRTDGVGVCEGYGARFVLHEKTAGESLLLVADVIRDHEAVFLSRASSHHKKPSATGWLPRQRVSRQSEALGVSGAASQHSAGRLGFEELCVLGEERCSFVRLKECLELLEGEIDFFVGRAEGRFLDTRGVWRAVATAKAYLGVLAWCIPIGAASLSGRRLVRRTARYRLALLGGSFSKATARPFEQTSHVLDVEITDAGGVIFARRVTSRVAGAIAASTGSFPLKFCAEPSLALCAEGRCFRRRDSSSRCASCRTRVGSCVDTKRSEFYAVLAWFEGWVSTRLSWHATHKELTYRDVGNGRALGCFRRALRGFCAVV